MSDMESLIFSCIDRYLGGGTGNVGGNRYHERHGIVTSYDPEKYLAKVTFMPEGQESGWVPIETSHIGNDYGVAIGLQPGDGKKSGDQVIVRYQEGDLESGKIVQRVHSDDEKPPTVQSGEIVLWSKFKKSTGKSGLGDDASAGGDDDEVASGGQGGSGQQIYFKNDGSISWTDGNGASIVMDGNGNIKLTCKNLTIDASGVMTVIAQGDMGLQSGGNLEVNATGTAGIDGAKVTVQGGGSVSDGSVSPPSQNPIIPKFTVTK
jgi:phage baseplate assembly protein gpV